MSRNLGAVLLYASLGLGAGLLLWGSLALLRSSARQSSFFRADLVARDAPLADLAQPIEGPARYHGILEGPPDRRTPLGHPAAAWWSTYLLEQQGEDPDKVACKVSEHTQLALRNGKASLPLAGIPATWDASRFSDADAVVAREPLVVLSLRGAIDHEVSGPQQRMPDGAAPRCERPWTRHEEDRIPPGTTVDVVACHSDGVLRACKGPAPLGLAISTDPGQLRARLRGDLLDGAAALGVASLLLMLVTLASSRGPRLAPWTSARSP